MVALVVEWRGEEREGGGFRVVESWEGTRCVRMRELPWADWRQAD